MERSLISVRQQGVCVDAVKVGVEVVHLGNIDVAVEGLACANGGKVAGGGSVMIMVVVSMRAAVLLDTMEGDIDVV